MTLIGFMLIIPCIITGQINQMPPLPAMKRQAAAEVPNRTIIIGTHMIALNTLDEIIKEVADKSAEESKQKKIYYKSEIATSGNIGNNSGIWFEIQNANEISRISPGNGTQVKDPVIDAIPLTHYTDPLGKMYDLRTNQEVDIFTVLNVYDVSSMPELASLKLQYETIKANPESSKKDTPEQKEKESMEAIFGLNVKIDPKVAELEKTMKELGEYYKYLISKNATDEEKGKFNEIRSAVNAQIKGLIIQNLIDQLNVQTARVSTLATPYLNTKQKLLDSKLKIDSQADILVVNPTDSLLKQKEAQLMNALISNTKLPNQYTQADDKLSDMLALKAISSNKIVDRAKQSNLVDEMYNNANSQYYELAIGGESDEYKRAKSQNPKSDELLDMKNNYQKKLASLLSDLEKIENEKIKLIPTKEGQVNELQNIRTEIISNIGLLKAKMTQNISAEDVLKQTSIDDFYNIGLTSLESRLSKIDSKIQAVNKTNISTKSNQQAKSLQDQVTKLQNNRKSALDKNHYTNALAQTKALEDLRKKQAEEAKKKQAQMDVKKTDLNKVNDKLQSGNVTDQERAALETQKKTLESDIAQTAASLSDESETIAKMIEDSKDKARTALSKVAMGEADIAELSDSINTLIELSKTHPDLTFDALKTIRDIMREKMIGDEGSTDELVELFTKLNNTVDQYDLQQDQKKITEESLNEKINIFTQDNELLDLDSINILGIGALNELLLKLGDIQDINNLTEDQKIIKQKMDTFLAELSGKDKRSKSSGINAVLIDKKLDQEELYAPADEVTLLNGMKYVYEPNLVRGYIYRGGKGYTFTHNSSTVMVQEKQSSSKVNKNKKTTMQRVSKFEIDQNTLTSILWIPQSFLNSEFEMKISPIVSTNKAILYDQQAEKLILDLLESIEV